MRRKARSCSSFQGPEQNGNQTIFNPSECAGHMTGLNAVGIHSQTHADALSGVKTNCARRLQPKFLIRFMNSVLVIAYAVVGSRVSRLPCEQPSPRPQRYRERFGRSLGALG